MSDPIVFVIFYSRCGATEKLALAAAVGATQARGLIRLRRLPDVNAATTIEAFAECKETLKRMHREYVAPSEIDILRADAIILAAPAGFTISSPEWTGYLDMLGRLSSEAKLAGKVAAVVDVGNETTLRSFSSRIIELGLAVAPASPDATALGRKVASMARALKQSAGERA